MGRKAEEVNKKHLDNSRETKLTHNLPQKLENDLPQFSTDGVIKFWSFKLHEDEWLEARLRAKTQHQKFLDWAKNNFKK